MGWVVGSVSSRGLTPAALVEPIAVAVHLEDVDVMGEAVEDRATWPRWTSRFKLLGKSR